MKRRSFVLGALASTFIGCTKTRTVVKSVHGGVECLELVPTEPDPALPLLVALHANGGAAEHWVDAFTKFPGRVRVILPRSFTPGGWFARSAPLDLANDQLAAEVEAAEKRLAIGLLALSPSRPIAVCGYAEGAMLSLVLARRVTMVLGAFSVAGACPRALLPKAAAAPVVAYHGGADDFLRIDAARVTIAAFKAAGGPAVLREYPGVAHDPSDAMHNDLNADIVKALEAGRSPTG